MEVWPSSTRTLVSLPLSSLSCLGRPAVPPPPLLRSPPPHLNGSHRYAHRCPISLPGAWKQSSSSWGQVPHQLISALLHGPVLLQLDPSERSRPPSARTHANRTFHPKPKEEYHGLSSWPAGPNHQTRLKRPLCQDLVQLILHSVDPSEALSEETPRRYKQESGSMAAILKARSG